jgi:hypothetical protein
MIRDFRGSTAIEVSVSMAFIVFAIISVFFVLYLSFVKVWAKTSIYDGLICLKQGEPETACHGLVMRRMQFVPFGYVGRVSLEPSGKGEMSYLLKSNWNFHFEQQLPEELR